MIKLIEPSLQIKCRKEDANEIKGMLKELESTYHKYMLDQTTRDEYTCTLSVIEGKFLTEDKDKGCGGIILYTENSRIVCPNTLINRLDLALEELLP